MISTILVALDTAPIAHRVLEAATEIAARFDAAMILLRAISIPAEFPAAAASRGGADPLPALLKHRALAEIAELAAGNARALARAPLVVTGEPWRVILETADQLEADLIVLGSHQYDWQDRLLGTTTARVANRGHHNVLVVHAPVARPATGA